MTRRLNQRLLSATGSLPLYYCWQRNGASIIGATNSTYSTNNVQLADSGSQFSCVVSNAYGSTNSQVATLTVLALPPTITQQPPNQTVPVGGTASFSVSATGSLPLYYCWQRNGASIIGATNSTYSTNNVQLADSGSQFSCDISNAYGSTNSQVATLTVLALPPTITQQPLNQTVSVGGNASFSVTATGSTPLSYFWMRNSMFIPGATNSIYTTNNVQLSDSGSQFSCVVSNAYGTTNSFIALLTVTTNLPASAVAYVRSTVGQPWGRSDNELILTMVFGSGWQDLRYESLNSAALFSTANKFIFMEGSDNNASVMGTFLTNNLPAISNWVAAGGSLLLNAAPNVGGNIYFGFGITLTYPDFTSSSIAVNPAHPIFNGPYLPVGTSFSGDYFGHGTVSGAGLTGLLTNSSDGNFVLAEQGYGAGHLMFGGMTLPSFHSPQPQATNLLANILKYLGNLSILGPLPPSITSQPTDQTVPVGGTASFSVSATGSLPLNYCWQRNGASIIGATNSTYSTNNVQLADSGSQFSCVVSNAYGTTNSQVATLTVLALPPMITQQPADWTVLVGGTASFTVSATGSLPMYYWWQRNGASIIGATNSTYSTNNVQLSDSGSQLSCVVSNAYGMTNSQVATLTVLSVSVPVFLTGSYLYLPIQTNGVFLADNTGVKFNTNGTGGASGVDFWEPGTPVYNTVVGVGGINYVNGSAPVVQGFTSVTVNNLSSGSLQRALISGVVVPGLNFSRDISFATNSKVVRIMDTLQNTTAAAFSNVVILDTADPDQDYAAPINPTTSTLNDVVSVLQTNDMVTATGPSTGLSVGFGTESGLRIPSAVGFNNLNAYALMTVVDPGGASADIDINLAENYGTLPAGQSQSVVWYQVFGASKAEVLTNFASVNLLDPLQITPSTGFASSGGAGGPFTVTSQSLTLTNAGTNSFTWSLVNTSLWLNVSPTGGALNPGGPAANVAVSLNTVASNLLVGSYSATLWFTNLSDGVGQSRVFTLNVLGAPVILTQPASLTAGVGGTATFSVNATGAPPVSYSWRRNGTPITGATQATYSTNNVQMVDSGSQFSCVVSNAFGLATSSNAVLTVVVAPPTDFILNGNYVSLPVATNGQFLSLRLAQGGRFNPAGTGGTNGVDFWWPGTPVCNYVVGVNSNNYVNGAFATLTVLNLSTATQLHALITGTLTSSVIFTRDVSFGINDKLVTIVDTIQNNRVTAISNVVTLDNIDPDQGYDGTPTRTYVTYNDVVSIALTNDAVVAVGTNNNLSLLLGSESGLQIPSAVGFNNINAYGYLTVVDPNGAPADIAINLAQNYGTLNAGQSKSVTWNMVFGSSYNEATNVYYSTINKIVLANITYCTNGQIQFSISGLPANVYYVQASTNLLNWLTISTITNASGTARFTDTNAPSYSDRFYRIMVGP